MKTISILNPISNHYRKFKENQTLTKEQLNEFIDYFNDQDHLSRIGLNGVGIVAGFDVTFLKKAFNDIKIQINQGYAVTTDGDLLFFQKDIKKHEKDGIPPFIINQFKDFTHFIKYDNNSIYEPFHINFRKKNEEQLKIWELKTSKGGENAKLLHHFEEDFEKMIVLLYLENFEDESDTCKINNCDNQGLEQISNLKVLLISEDNIARLLENDDIYSKHNWKKFRSQLPELKLKRVILNNLNTVSYETLSNEYSEIIKYNDSIQELVTGYDSIFSKFGKKSISNEIKKHFNFTAFPEDFQYRYDVLRDLIDTYDEIKELLLHINVECCPNINSFQKHILLGKVVEEEKYDTFRHSFYKTPFTSHEDNNYKKVLSLIDRAKYISTKYKPFTGQVTTRITPSNTNKLLGEKAIPFYYSIDNDFLDAWNYEKTKNYLQKHNLGYSIDKLAQADYVQNPLSYSIDKNDFLRIEGHQGKHYKDVLEELAELKTQNGLAFDVKALSINLTDQDINIDDYECEFEELSMLLKAWRAEQNSILAEMSRFFSGFSTITPGANVVVADIDLEVTVPHAKTKNAASKNTQKFVNKKENAVNKAPIVDRINIDNNTAYFSNTVEQELTLQDYTLGPIILEAINLNPMGSANDIMATYQDNISDHISGDWENDSDLKDFILTDVVDTLVHSYILDNNIPILIQEIDHEVLQNYNLTIEGLCLRVKKLQAQYQHRDVKQGSKEILGLLINQLSIVCSSGKKLEILLEEIEKRKKEILTDIQLTKFVESHPGLQHNAGVPIGGTFVVVYVGKKVVAARKDMRINLREIQPRLTRISGGTYRDRLPNVNLPIVDQEKGRFRPINPDFDFGWSPDSGWSPDFDFPNPLVTYIENIVIADFSLPYTCCSDCSTVNFVLAKPPVKLRIEKDVFCIGKDKSPLRFQVTPDKGTIKMDPIINGLSINGDILNIDVDTVSEDDYGKQIKFTVNDQVTDAELRILKNPDFDFNYIITKSKAPNSDPMAKEVTISGFVSDASGKALIGVSVVINGTDQGTSTDFDGRYTILTHIGDQLIYSQIGMKTESRTVLSADKIDVIMTQIEDGEDNAIPNVNSISVNFTVQGVYLPKGVKFAWDFGDKTQEPNRFEENPRHIYNLPDDQSMVTVKLIVTSGSCQKTVTHDVSFARQKKAVESATCKDLTISNFNAYDDSLNAINRIPNEMSSFQELVITPIKESIVDFIKLSDDYITGKKNKQLLTIYIPVLEYINKLIDTLSVTTLKTKTFSTVLKVIIHIIYGILACQTEVEETSETDDIRYVLLPLLQEILSKLKDKNINIDVKGELKDNLNTILKTNNIFWFLPESINIVLDFLTFNA